MLILFHDFTSPASAVAALRLQRLADEGLPVAFEGFDANSVDGTLPLPVNVTVAIDELMPTAAQEGLLLKRPSALPPTARAHAIGDHADASGLGASWRHVCYHAFWEEHADIGNPAVLIGLAERAGLDRGETMAVLSDPAAVVMVRRRSGARRREGVGGVPTILAHHTLVAGLLPEEDLRGLLLAE